MAVLEVYLTETEGAVVGSQEINRDCLKGFGKWGTSMV